jgi:hypothetical protein
MLTTTLALLLAAAPFPLPSVDGKALAVSPTQKVFRLPMRFEKVRGFYQEQFTGDDAQGVTSRVSGASGKRVLTITSKRPGDPWTKALVREGEVDTVIEVTAVLQMKEESVSGSARPLVQFVIGRSADVQRAVEAIGDKHVNQLHP